ncbi:MAG: hypothetical protein A2Y03_00460 [Omnitrophica WOR_2 bacterium GWF2_38_59]|nr:MAG: hypothetical protein A2Y03_00460 [Omnitrophica WOR_2 bacterium GWF2_38_59]OGX47740.1 MAG: hypothetical protein A2243_00350 [Omnitrophica WOR_2 bacterium RIFOXYA2_FULL_38_17]OGX50430.1 MAG: hypothetical protein A2267_09265 [Omnitrophica WOR_2 bacterium RIFOXYA12_FULL_38_10]OGX55779.1 MAG: hypothetical protein A2306_11040 [Omnitrophica WOR_2 bacterium RIFOXYB2_FULL_38_16]HBG60379.1 hypothetical protein [Candidatus Omnitrophota bacterium]
MPKSELYIMLNHKKKHFKYFFRLFTLLFFISLIITQNISQAEDEKLKAAEEYREQGYEQQQKGNLSDAFTFYSKAIALGLENPAIFNDLGIISEQIGFDGNAEKFYLKAIEVDQKYLPSYMNLAYFYQKINKLEDAFRNFKMRYELGSSQDHWTERAKQEMIKIHPEYKQWTIRIDAEKFNQELVKAEEEKLKERINRSKAHYQQGRSYCYNGRYDEAIDEYDNALALSPDDSVIKDERTKCATKFIKEIAASKTNQAMQLLESGNYVAAKNKFREVLSIIPNESF